MSVKNLLGRVKELRERIESCEERMKILLQDYQVNVLQTAAVIAAAKINEEKAEIEKKRRCLHEQIEKEKERGRETVNRVYKSAGETIQALVKDYEQEIQAAKERQHTVNETNVKTTNEFAGTKRKLSEIEESTEYDEEELSTSADNESKGFIFECTDCGRRSPNMYMCPCHTSAYCDEICQQRDWDRHRQYCLEQTTVADD